MNRFFKEGGREGRRGKERKGDEWRDRRMKKETGEGRGKRTEGRNESKKERRK